MNLIDKYQWQGYGLSAFAQLIFSDLTEIGCSTNICQEKDGTESRMFVCFLSPQGPLAGKPIYQRPQKKEDVGKINCTSNGSKEPYNYLCPRNS